MEIVLPLWRDTGEPFLELALPSFLSVTLWVLACFWTETGRAGEGN